MAPLAESASCSLRTNLLAVTAAFTVALLAVILLAPDARAGTYEARFCDETLTPDGDNGPFQRSGNETIYQLTNACGGLNGLRVSHNAGQPGSEGAFGRWLADRPDQITVASIAYQASGVRQAGYFPQVIGTTPGADLGILQGDQNLDGSFRDFTAQGDVRRFGVQLICQTGGGACAANPPGNPEARLRNIRYTLNDPTPPTIAVTGGSLFEEPAQTGAQSILYQAGDAGSGVARVILVVNGQDATTQPGECNIGKGFALSFKPCTGTAVGTITANTAVAPWRNGRNKVKVCVEDYSSDSRQCTETSNVLALNGCGINTTPAQTMTLGWPGKRGVVRSRQGRSRKATAQVFAPGRLPIPGASVCFSRRIPTDKSGKERILEGNAVTGADGRAAVRVRGQTSRIVRATYFAGPEDVLTETIKLNVSPALRIGLRPAGKVEVGDKVRVVGVLRGKFKGGRKVCFYASKPGRDKFACDTSGRGGRARAGFKTKEPGKVRFYAKVPNQRNYPYTRGRSKTKRKTVLP